MNVYDFDKTIYDGDSSIDFYLYCLRTIPRIVRHAGRQTLGILQHSLGIIDTKTAKERFFSFLYSIDDPSELLASFWSLHQKNIKRWYLERTNSNDVIVSASPEFLLEPICSTLGISQPIATRMNPQTGMIHGANCKGREKVSRFLARFPNATIQEFYSDSISDAPLAELASSAFLVVKNSIKPWPAQRR